MYADIIARYPALRPFCDQLGGTPLMHLPATSSRGAIFAKCEWHNPSGSIKDRAGFAMLASVLREVEPAECQELHLLEYSGGNLAATLARLCAPLGIGLTLVLSTASNPSLLRKLAEFGVEVELVDKEKGFYAVMERAMELSARNPRWKFLYQHENEANLRAHREGTGQEILLAMMGRRIDAWTASIGTGGTLVGVYEALRRVHPQVQLHAVSPSELPYGSPATPTAVRKYAGSGGLGCGRRQSFVAREEASITRFWSYSFPETLVRMKRFLDETGVRIGTSAAANLMAAEAIAAELGPESTVVTLFPCAGSPEEWALAEQGSV